MTASSPPVQHFPTAWQVETARFRALRRRWLDYWLTEFFDLTIRGPRTRRRWVMILGLSFLVAGSILHIIFYYIPVLAPVRPFAFRDVPLFGFLTLARLLIVLFIPAYIAITRAGNYLADIFELKDRSVAWDYIGTLSISGWDDLLHILESKATDDHAPAVGSKSQKYILRIHDGQVDKDSLNSPAYLIGGPGIVMAAFDSAALFEKPDGTPHIVGASSTAPDAASKQNAVLDGFERLREPIINLRDQYIGSLSGEAMNVLSRSRDGIPVSAADVRGMFSVIRRKAADLAGYSRQPTYPFEPDDIQKIIYQQTVSVKAEGPNPSGEPGLWTAGMQGLIRGALGEFMSQHNLGEYLAGIGAMESELSEFREDSIVTTTLSYSKVVPESSRPDPSPQKFHPRTELLDGFNQSSGAFPQRVRGRGLQLHWINVGTWKMPDELSEDQIRYRHMDAWRLNRENARQSRPENLEHAREDAYYNGKLRLIEKVPLEAHQKNRARSSEKKDLVEGLLQNFHQQMGEALDDYYENANLAPELQVIEAAVLRIERLLNTGRAHVVGGSSFSKVRLHTEAGEAADTPPAPESPEEEDLYMMLLSYLDGDYRAAEGLIAREARRNPGRPRIELIRHIIARYERFKQ